MSLMIVMKSAFTNPLARSIRRGSGLDGSLRSVPGVAPMVGAVGERDVVVPVNSAIEARVAAKDYTGAITRLEKVFTDRPE